MNTTIPRLTSRKCHRCGNFLILSDEKTEKVEGQYGPVTTSTYTCSDPECQKQMDKEIAKMKKQKVEKEIANEKRLERINLSRKQAKEKKMQEQTVSKHK